MNKPQRLLLLVAVSIVLSMLLAIVPEGNQPASASYEVRPNMRVYLDPSINKKFVPVSIPPGGTSRLTVYVYNPNDYELVNVAWTDQLQKLQPGIQIAANPLVVSTCGGTVTAVPGSDTFALAGGTVPPKVGAIDGECEVAVNVTSFVSGNLDNEFVPGDLYAEDVPEPGDEMYVFTNPTGVTETLNVANIASPSVTKSFSPTTVWAGQRTRLRVNIRNNDTTYPLNQVSITDNLPANFTLANPVNAFIHSNCGTGATLTAVAGETSATLNNARIPANATCYFDVYVSGSQEGTFTNTIPANAVSSYEQVTNPNPASANITVNGVQMAKSFSPTSFLAGEGSATMTLTIRNPYTAPLTNATISDPLPGVDLVYVPGTASTTCQTGGSPATLTLSDSDRNLTLTDGTVPAGVNNAGVITVGTCTITVTVTAPGNAAGGLNRNQIPVGALTTDEGYSNTNSPFADITVNPQSIGVSKGFSPSRFELGGTTYVIITLSNPTSTVVTNVNLTDELPIGLEPVIPADVASTCGGTVTVDATSSPTSFTLTNGTIAANASCNFRARVTTSSGASAGDYTNTIPANAITGAGITNQSGASRTVNVYPVNLGVRATKAFFDSNLVQPTSANIRMRLRFQAPEDETLTNVSITDVLPANLVITNSSAPTVSNCGAGASLSAPTDGNTITLTNGTINAAAWCEIDVWVSGELPGDYTNTMLPENFTNDSDQTFPAPVSDTLRVSDFLTQKSFFPTKINVGGRSTLTITLINENSLPMENVWLQDRLNTMGTNRFAIAPEPNASTTCGGTVTANAGANIITLTGGNIPGRSGLANGTCTISVDVIAQPSAITSTNTIARTDATAELAGTGTPVNPRANSTAVLTVADMKIDLVKSFDPSAVFGGSVSRLSILLINPNDVPLIDIAFSDFMPAGMEVGLPTNIDTGTCGGTVTVAPDLFSFSYEGGYLAAERRCTISLNATIRVNGNLVNTIPAGAVSTFNGVTNPDPASSTLTNLPGISVKKYFTPNRVLAAPDEYSILTLDFRNTGNAPVTGMALTDVLPAGLVVASGAVPAPTNTCGGTLTATPGATSVQLSGASLAGGGLAGDTCSISLAVEAAMVGSYRNTIAEGDVTSDDPNATNPDPAEDTLIVYGTPAMEIVKNVISAGPYNEGDTITYEIIATNTGDLTLPNVQVTDPGVGVALGACVPVNGSTLAAGASMTCAATYQVTAADILAGEFINTAFADSDKTDPVSDTETVPLSGGPAMSVKKSSTTTGPYVLGSTISYEIVVRNIGTIILNNVQVTDPGVGVSLGSCVPALGSSLDIGDSMTCTASYVVTQADVDAGSFTNVAYGDSDETDLESDSLTVPVAQYPGMAVYKYEITSGIYAVGDTIEFEIVVQNTGNTTLINVTVSDTGTELPLGPCVKNEDPTVVPLPTTMQINDKLYCEAYHVVTQADIDAGTYVNVAIADSDQTSPESGTETTRLVQIPMINLVKTGTVNDDVVAPAGQVDAGDTITYTFRVENTGNVTLTNVNITDAVVGVVVSGGPITLAPGQVDTTTFTGTYSITQANIDAGTFTNTATVSSESPRGNIIRDDDDDTQNFVPNPAIEVLKTGTLVDDVVLPAGQVNAGDQITYEFTVTNTGNVTLSDITITDAIPGVTILGGPITLTPGDSDSVTFTGIYTLTQVDVDAGTFTNTATASGTDPNSTVVTDDDDDTQTWDAEPSISLEKNGTLNDDVVAPAGVVNIGDTITYTFTVTNTGNVTLSNITITDIIPGVNIVGGPITLAPGDSDTSTFTGTFTLTQSVVDALTFTNTATVSGTDPHSTVVTDDDSDIKSWDAEPSILLEKTGVVNDNVVAPSGVVNVGDTITYTFTVTNTGNVTLYDITLADTIGGVTIGGGPIASLAGGASDSTTFSGTYTLTLADVDNGSFTNTATVTGTDPYDTEVNDDDDDVRSWDAEPSIELVKTGTLNDDVGLPAGQVNEGDTITYTFTVTNTGNVTLYDITLTDTIGGVTISGGPIVSLIPGASDSTTFTGTYTLTQPDVDAGTFTNTATVSGTDPHSTVVTDDDSDIKSWDAEPSITLVKTGTLNDAVVVPSGVVNAGDTITYTFTVTNTGNVTLSDITISDAIAGVTILGGPITLAPGASDSTTFTGSYTLTQTIVDAGTFTNTATVTGTDPHDTEVTDEDDDTKTWDAVPSIALEKTGVVNDNVVAPSGVVNAGDTITYTFTVTNTGNVTLYDITLVDTIGGVTIMGGPIVSLAGGASDSTTFSGTYTLTLADVDNGSFTNTATVTGTDPYDTEVNDDDDDVRNWDAEPSIELVKTGTLNDDVVLPAGQVNEGDTITYAFTVTNTGNVTLTNITLADTVGGVTISGGPIVSLIPGASDSTTFTGTYTLTQPDVDAGSFTNTATVTGTDPNDTEVTDDDDDTQTWDAEPSITLVKTGTLNDGVIAPSGVVNAGDTITYTFTVTNTGNVTLSDITITDAIPGVTILGGPITLAPGASDSTTFTGSYTLTQTIVDAGTFTNTATVSGTDPHDTEVTDDDDDTKTWDAVPGIELVKTGTINDDVVAPAGQVDAGDTITYTFTVTNTGNVTLNNITLADTVGGVTISGGPIASLAPGASNSTTFTGTYTLTLTDINNGGFTNTATVSGTDPHSTVVTDDDDDTQTLTAAPAIDLVKTGTLNDGVVLPAGQVNAGDTITYTFTVTNTGNVTLSGISITDAIAGVTIIGGPITLVPGASDATTFTGTYTLTQAVVDAGTFTNTATASGTDPHDTEVTDDDDDTQTWDAEPSIELVKEGTLNMDVVAPDDEPDEGDTITYIFTVTNTGNVTLFNITLADTVGGVTISGGPIASLVPGAVDDTTFSGTYTLTQIDVDSGSFTNTATVTGTDPHSTVVTDEDDDLQDLDEFGMLGLAKRVSSGPTRVSAGTWQFSYQIYVENYGNVTLSNVQVADDLSAIFGAPHVFSVVSVVSSDFVLNSAYDGESDIQLLAENANTLAVGQGGRLTITVELIPANGGPFNNTAIGTATTPSDEEVTDLSQDGTDPDPDGDDDPTNNNDPTPLDFGPNLFDPPFGIKTFDNAGLPLLRWTMIWINDSNIVAINAAVSDPIPSGTQFFDDGIPSGYPLPTGALPAGSTTNGVTCGVAEGTISTTTTTTYCYYEGPTTLYPRGRIVWEGTLGPDLGATNAEEAVNELYITFAVRVNGGVTNVNNTGTIGADLDGDGVITGDEVVVAEAEARWFVDVLPETGFAPGVITQLPLQPAELAYQSAGIVLEIPRLGVRTSVVTVPFSNGGWDVTWLGNSAGYLEGSAYPTWKGNTVITAHNWTPLNRPGIFANLNDLMYGDQIKVHAFGQTYTYEMRSRQLISSRNLTSAFKTESLDWVTLMTCEGFDETSGDYRFRRLVRAVLVSVE